MNINISNFYSDNLSNKASSLLMSSPNLQDSFMSSLHTERQESEGVNKVSYEITPDKQQDKHQIQAPYQIPEASIESSYRLDIIKNPRKYSPGLLTNKEKRIQEKRAKNFNEFHKSLENLASKRLIRTNTQDSNQSIFEMKGNMSMGNVDGGDTLGVKRRFERFHSTQWGPANSNIAQSHPTLTRPASFYEKDYEPRYLRTECYDDEGSGGHYGIAALANQQINKADDKARTRMAKRTRHHTHMNINNTLRQSPPKGHALMNSISSTSLYNNRDKQTFYTDAKYSYSPNTDFMFNRSSGAGSKQRKPTFPTEIHYYDREKMIAVDTEGKSIDRKFLEFSSVNGSDSKFGTQRTDFGHSLYEAPSIRGSYQLRPNQYYRDSVQNKRSNQTSVDKRQRRLMGSKDYGLYERLDQNSISEGVQYGSGGVGQCDVPKGMRTGRSNSRSHKRKGTEIRSRKELEELNDTIQDDNHARVSLQDYRLSGVDRETVGHWKKDLMEIKQDIEKRKVSYHEVSEQLKRYEAEGLLEQIEKELDALSSPEKGINEQAPPPQSPVFQAKRNHRRSTRIFDMDTLATRVSKEAYELSNVEWLHKEKKMSPGVKTMEDWDEMKPVNEGRGNRQIIDPKTRIKTTLCNEFNNETSFGYDHGGLQHEQRNYPRCCGGESSCNMF